MWRTTVGCLPLSRRQHWRRWPGVKQCLGNTLASVVCGWGVAYRWVPAAECHATLAMLARQGVANDWNASHSLSMGSDTPSARRPAPCCLKLDSHAFVLLDSAFGHWAETTRWTYAVLLLCRCDSAG